MLRAKSTLEALARDSLEGYFHSVSVLHDAMLTETAGPDVDFSDADLAGANLQRSTITTLGGGPR